MATPNPPNEAVQSRLLVNLIPETAVAHHCMEGETRVWLHSLPWCSCFRGNYTPGNKKIM